MSTSNRLLPALPMRCGTILMSDMIDVYLALRRQRPQRVQRLAWWQSRVGALTLQDLSDDHVHAALEDLASRPARYFAGRDEAASRSTCSRSARSRRPP